jgi:hypothetical protein
LQDLRAYFSPELADALYIEPGALESNFAGPHNYIGKIGVYGCLDNTKPPVLNPMKLRLQLKNLSCRFPTTLVVTTFVDLCWEDCELFCLIPLEGAPSQIKADLQDLAMYIMVDGRKSHIISPFSLQVDWQAHLDANQQDILDAHVHAALPGKVSVSLHDDRALHMPKIAQNVSKWYGHDDPQVQVSLHDDLLPATESIFELAEAVAPPCQK